MPTLAGAPEGGQVYGYLYWDAHEKRLLAKSRERNALVEQRRPFKPRKKYEDWQPYALPTDKRFGSAKELAVVRFYCESFDLMGRSGIAVRTKSYNS